MSPAARWGGLFLWLFAPGVWALGLGDIELDSALNQPLRAEIQLVSATEEELDSLGISLADEATFDRYGLDRPTFLTDIEFSLAQDGIGGAVISVTSTQPIAEPFVTILIEANWLRGRMLREYTVLLDPPVLLPATVVALAVQPAQGGVSPAPQPAAPIERPTPAALTPVQTPQAASSAQPASPPPVAITQPVPQPVAQAPDSYGPVHSAETLWSIADRFRPAGVTTNQMMVAIFRANPQSFSGNMNTLHQGASLRIPSSEEFAGMSAADATQEAQRQVALWRGETEAQARLRLVTPEESAAVEIAGGFGSQATESPAAGALVGGNAGAAQVAELEGELQALRAQLTDSQRLLEIRDQQLQELQLLLEAADEAQQAAAAASAVAFEIPAEPAVSSAGVDLEQEQLFADEPAAPVVTAPPAATRVVTSVPPEPSLVLRILGALMSPLLLIGFGLLALVGTAAWYLRHRQQDIEDVTGRWEALEADLDDEDAETREATERIRQQQAEGDVFLVDEETSAIELALPDSPQDDSDLEGDLAAATGASNLDELELSLLAGTDSDEGAGETLTIGVPPSEPEHDDTVSSHAVINLEQVDPVAEADFHMAYGLYDQAAELVEKALELEPGRRDLTLKLLEVFFVWGNKDSFLQTSQVLHAEIGGSPDADWDKVVIMGKQICPDDALFTATAASAGAVDVDLEAGGSPELDISFDSEDTGSVDLDLGDLSDDDIDLELDVTDVVDEPALGGDDISGVSDDDGIDESLDLDLTGESEVIEQTSEIPSVKQSDGGEEARDPDDRTAEIDLDDLGLDVENLAGLTSDLNALASSEDTGENAVAEGEEVLSSFEIADVLTDEAEVDFVADDDVVRVVAGASDSEAVAIGDQDETLLVSSDVADETILATGDSDAALLAPGYTANDAVESAKRMRQPSAEDFDLADLESALEEADTVEEPIAQLVGSDVLGDVGTADADAAASSRSSMLDPNTMTMTEVGTKLDLARAYMDMGDPDGAMSILEEVLEEGDENQKQEAQGLIENL